MVHIDPAQRPTIEEISNEKWLQTPIDSEKIKRQIIAQQSWGKSMDYPLPMQKSGTESYIDGDSINTSVSVN